MVDKRKRSKVRSDELIPISTHPHPRLSPPSMYRAWLVLVFGDWVRGGGHVTDLLYGVDYIWGLYSLPVGLEVVRK